MSEIIAKRIPCGSAAPHPNRTIQDLLYSKSRVSQQKLDKLASFALEQLFLNQVK